MGGTSPQRAGAGAPALRTEGLTKHFGDVEALSDLDLEVRPGEVFGFLGPNGSGKTTMIRTVLDEIRPTRGRAWILGMDTHAQSVEIRHRIGYLPGDLALYPRLTGHDTLRFFAKLRGGVDWAYVDALAERLGADLSKRVGDLSTGNRQKVGLIQAFMNRPDLLIMDEPSTGLDPLVQREFQTMVREVVAEGRSVFLSSHTLSEVQRVADRVGIIRHGRLAATESLDALADKAVRKVELHLTGPVDPAALAAIDGVSDVIVDGDRAAFSYLGTTGSLLDALGPDTVIDIATHDADLEEIFLTYYRDPDAPEATPRQASP